MKYLVKFKCDWADEFDGFTVHDTKEELEKIFTFAKAYWEEYPNKEVDIYFGTNECLQFDSLQSYKECFEVIPVTDEEAKFLLRCFPGWGDQVNYGQTDAMYFADHIINYEDVDNERLTKLADELWPPRVVPVG